MKARIKNYIFCGLYSEKWITENFNRIVDSELVSDWNLTEKIPTDEELKYHSLMFNFDTNIFYEGATPEEIQEQQIKNALFIETEKYKQRQADGVQMYAEISAEFRLAKLSGLMSESTQSAIERILISVRNEVLAGQWVSARNELELIGNSIIGVDLYDRLHNQISNYITENY